MTSKYSVGALVGALMLVVGFWSYPANALTFQFSFTNNLGNDPAQSLVQGIISGLLDNTANQPALSVQVTSNPAGFGVGEYVGVPLDNFFTVSGGVITSALFHSFGSSNSSPAVTCCSLALELAAEIKAGLSNRGDLVSVFFTGSNPLNLVFTPVVPQVPLPAALPLFATGLGALGLFGWRRKKKAAALAA